MLLMGDGMGAMLNAIGDIDIGCRCIISGNMQSPCAFQ
jgi:hypothetical protein